VSAAQPVITRRLDRLRATKRECFTRSLSMRSEQLRHP